MAVIGRIRQYITGISDSATVVEVPGARVFETWLHQFFGRMRKPIKIRFAFTVVQPGSPREWFDLTPEIAQILEKAFISDPPRTVDDVLISDLPVFLSGAMTAIRWHAEQESPENLAVMEAVAKAQSLLTNLPNVRITAPSNESGKLIFGSPIVQGSSDTASATLLDQIVGVDVAEAMIELARLRARIEVIRETEALRNYIAIATFILTGFIWAFGAPSAAVLLALIGTILFAGWPNILPRAAAWLVGLMQHDAIAARARH